jgi:uncharacterized protein YuzE
LTIRYDRVGDILYIDRCRPYREQESEEAGDEIIVRLNPRTREVENVEILFFSRRFPTGEAVELPLFAEIRLAS